MPYSQNCHRDDIDCGNIAEQISDRVDKPIIIDTGSESDSVPSPSRKRAATASSPKQPCKKATRAPSPPPEDTSLTDNQDSQYSRRRKSTQRGRESRQQQKYGKRKGTVKEKTSGKEQQLTLSQFDQTEGLARRLGGMSKRIERL